MFRVSLVPLTWFSPQVLKFTHRDFTVGRDFQERKASVYCLRQLLWCFLALTEEMFKWTRTLGKTIKFLRSTTDVFTEISASWAV
jgi:hypothetical protein